jgi:outer membrane lipoprotein-sorting protein
MSGVELIIDRTKDAERVAWPELQKPAITSELPERPMLAPYVYLIGEMPGTGFTERQWLIQRDGRFIQVTKLLYRVAEQANGERTLEEMAKGVTESTDWIVDADDVRQLIQTKLIPLGLIARADDFITSPSGATVQSQGYSPLALTLRMQALSPRLIDPITKVLQIFYAPPILISILIVAGLTHWWLYREHGATDSMQDALYTPGGLLLTLLIIILAGMFHELGHAAALRYGGGKVQSMGVGLYLVYPVLYTDVTDSYRLGRWARVRTDLGGIYFHLIFALGLIIFSSVSGQEFLLFPALLINLEMIHQLLPFVRMDGYWLLADLTGIPDFFSQTGPFLRSILPARRVRGDKLPALKPWVRAVFVTYLIVTVPLLACIFLLMIRNLPRLLTWTWDAFLKQITIFSVGQRQGDFLIMVLASTQMLLLMLSVVGTLYIISSVAYKTVRAIWNWSRLTTARRAAGALSAAAVTGCVILLWAPQLRGLPESRAALMQTDKVGALLKQTREATAKLHTLQAELEGSFGSDHFTGTVMLKRPNLARVDVKGEGGLGEFLVVSNGKSRFVYFPADDQYAHTNPGPEGRNIRAFVVEQVEHFFRPDTIEVTPTGSVSRYVGRETVDGSEYEIVETETSSPRKKTTRYFISPTDHLVHRVVTTTERKDGQTATAWSMLKNVQPDVAIEETAFQWSPPSTASPLQLPPDLQLPAGKGNSHQ